MHQHPQIRFAFSPQRASRLLMSGLVLGFFWMAGPLAAKVSDWSVGAYAGQYHDTEPAGAITGKTRYLEQYMLAVTGSKTLWRAQQWPVSLEIDGMVGYQWGQATLAEVAVAPALRWSGLPGRDVLRVDFRAAPLGVSYTNIVSPLEKGPDGRGSRGLNFLFLELTASRPQAQQNEYFVRLHHRCTIYDLLNDYGANGEDFLALGFRRRF